MGQYTHPKSSIDQITIEGQCDIGFGQARVLRKFWNKPIDVCGEGNRHHLELSLLPLSDNARGCFLDFWNPQRFEPFGEVFLLPAYHRVRAKSDCRYQNSIVCSLDPARVNKWFDANFEWTDIRLQNSLNIGNQRIRALLFQIGEEIRNPGFGCETLVELMVAQVVIEVTRYLSGINEEDATGGLSPWRLKIIEQRIGDISSQPSLTELAEICDLSVRHLTRAFRASRGRSIGSYIAEKRTEHAKRLITSGMSIKSVAYTMGFSAPSNFTTSFVRSTGETPTQYRLRVCGGTVSASFVGNTTH